MSRRFCGAITLAWLTRKRERFRCCAAVGLALPGDAIPLSGRIAELSDFFDALTSVRPYKKAWSVETAVDLIEENAGKHFDPPLVEVFVRELPTIIEIGDRYPG